MYVSFVTKANAMANDKPFQYHWKEAICRKFHDKLNKTWNTVAFNVSHYCGSPTYFPHFLKNKSGARLHRERGGCMQPAKLEMDFRSRPKISIYIWSGCWNSAWMDVQWHNNAFSGLCNWCSVVDRFSIQHIWSCDLVTLIYSWCK